MSSTSRGVTMPRSWNTTPAASRSATRSSSTLAGRCVSKNTASLCARITGTRTVVAAIVRSARPSILRVSATTFCSSPVSPSPSNPPTCGTTLRKIGAAERRVGVLAALLARERVEAGAAGPADRLIRRDADAAQPDGALDRRQRDGQHDRRAVRDRKDRGARRGTSCGFTSGTMSGTPGAMRKVDELSITTVPASTSAPASSALASSLEAKNATSGRSATSRSRVAAATGTLSPRNAHPVGALARRVGEQRVDPNVALLEHAQDRSAHDAGRADDRYPHRESPSLEHCVEADGEAAPSAHRANRGDDPGAERLA